MTWETKITKTSEWVQLIARLPTLLIWWIVLLAFVLIMQLAGFALGSVKPKAKKKHR